MKWDHANPQASLRRVAAIILLAGWATAGVIYFTVDEVPENPGIDQIENSRMLRRELELYGGKLNLMGHDLSRWFARQWQGKALWFPIAALTSFTSLVLFVVADHIEPLPTAPSVTDPQRHDPTG